MTKVQKRKEAIKLRKKGKSIKEIAAILRVSPASICSWCKNIQLTKDQKIQLEKRRVDPNNPNRLRYFKEQHEKFTNMLIVLKSQGRKQVGKLNEREKFLIGIALYWSEGFKKDHQVGFANTDPKMIIFFIYWLKNFFNIKVKDLILRVTINNNYKKQSLIITKYWAKQLSVPLTQFSKPYFQHTVQKKTYHNPNDYHGVLRIKVRRSVNLLRKIYGFIDGISSQTVN